MLYEGAVDIEGNYKRLYKMTQQITKHLTQHHNLPCRITKSEETCPWVQITVYKTAENPVPGWIVLEKPYRKEIYHIRGGGTLSAGIVTALFDTLEELDLKDELAMHEEFVRGREFFYQSIW